MPTFWTLSNLISQTNTLFYLVPLRLHMPGKEAPKFSSWTNEGKKIHSFLTIGKKLSDVYHSKRFVALSYSSFSTCSESLVNYNIPQSDDTVLHKFRLGSCYTYLMKNVLKLQDILLRYAVNLLCYEMRWFQRLKWSLGMFGCLLKTWRTYGFHFASLGEIHCPIVC